MTVDHGHHRRPAAEVAPIRRLVLFAALVLLVLPLSAIAQERRVGTLIAVEWQRTLDSIERSIGVRRPTEDQAERHHRILAAIMAEAREVERQARADIEASERLIEALGPPPSEGQPAETPEVARQRKDMNETLAVHRARLAQAEVTIARAQALQADLAAATRERFLQHLTTQLPPPLADPVSAGTAAGLAGAALGDAFLAAGTWLTGFVGAGSAAFADGQLLLLMGCAGLFGWSGRRLLLRSLGPLQVIPTPGVNRRLVVASGRTLAHVALPAALIGAAAFFVQQHAEIAADVLRRLFFAGCLALLAIAVAWAAARTVAASQGTPWQLTPLTADAGRHLAWRSFAVVGLAILAAFVVRLPVAAPPPPELVTWTTLAFAIVAALVAGRFVSDRAWRRDQPQPRTSPSAVSGEDEAAPPWRWGTTFALTARAVIVTLALAAVVAALLGYSNLGHYLAQNMLLLITAFLVAVIVRAVIREVVLAFLRALLIRAGDPRGAARATEDRYWLSLLIDPLLVLAAAYLLAPAWRLPRHDLLLWVQSIAEGVRFGGITISPVDALLAVATFGLALAVTRAVRNSLADRILPHTRLDRGVRHSIAVGVGYVGVSLSALLSIAVLGIDLSNLALVAGALSVGIGFGLQNIVSNFISGLILLIERPVKVGDYVMIGDQQGFVRRIKVRSTELETFERSTIIVPNSDLLSQTVVNWTHKDTIGRVDVRVGVAYGTEPERVQAILMACAQAHPDVTRQPAPFVLFQDFGDNALLFELRAFLFDVSRRLRVGSDLRIAIDRAFRAEGIEIPCAQREVWLTHAGPPEAASAMTVPASRGSGDRGRQSTSG